jgi:hypothetical protein
MAVFSVINQIFPIIVIYFHLKEGTEKEEQSTLLA